MEAYEISTYELCYGLTNSKSGEENAVQDIYAKQIKPDCIILTGPVELDSNPYCRCGIVPPGAPLPNGPGSQALILKAKKGVSSEREAPEHQVEKMYYCKLITECHEKTTMTKADESSCSPNNLARFSSVHDISKLMSETNQFKERLSYFEKGLKNSTCFVKDENMITSRPYDHAGNFCDDTGDERNSALENVHRTSLEIECKSIPCICQQAFMDCMRKLLRQECKVLHRNKTGPDLIQINAYVASACRQSL